MARNWNIYKPGKPGADGTIRHPKPKSCGQCHGTGERLNDAGRPMGRKCRSCGGSGLR